MRRAAVLGFDDLCRFILERGAGQYCAAWLGCNPSTADASRDDPTAGRIYRHTGRAGYQRYLLGNVWAWRTTYPRELWPALVDGRYSPAMRSANLDALAAIGAQASCHIAAFGAEPYRRQPRDVMDALDAFTLGGRHPLYCLGTTDDGLPLHPLARGKFAVRNDALLRRWERGERLLAALDACK